MCNKTDGEINATHLYTDPIANLIRVSYVVVASLGIIFNVLICLMILKHRHLRTVVNLLILNLATANIVACLNTFPLFYLNIDKTAISGRSADLLCGVSEGLSIFFVGGTVSIQTLSVLSISRYLVIHRPFWFPWRINRQNLKYIFLFLWICSIALVIPNFMSFEYDVKKKFCFKQWAVGVKPVMYLSAVAVLNVVMPLTSLFFTYCTTLSTLLRNGNTDMSNDAPEQRNNRVAGNRNSNISHTTSNYRGAGIRNSTSLGSSSNRVKKHVVLLLGMLIVVYLVCWMPFIVYWLLSIGVDYFGDVNSCDNERLKGVRICRAVVLVAMCSTVLNPLAYACSNSHLRTTIREIFKGNKVSSFFLQRLILILLLWQCFI